MRITTILASATLAVTCFTMPASAALVNSSFEVDNAAAGDVPGATGWGGFNFFLTSATTQRTGAQSLKLFGDFTPGGASGAFQNQPAVPGVSYTASVFARHVTGDAIQLNNFGLLQLIFLDAANAAIQPATESAHFGSTSALDTWAPLSATAVAPLGTVSARIQLLHVQANNPVTGGAVFFDDADLDVTVPEPSMAFAAALGAGALLAGLVAVIVSLREWFQALL